MKTNLRVEISTTEIEVRPPWYAADPDNPTEEENAENEASFQIWEADGGKNQRRLRAILTAGPKDEWSDSAGEIPDLKRKAIESPMFLVNNVEARIRAEYCMCDMIGYSIAR